MAKAISLVKGQIGQAAPLGFLNHAVEFTVGEVMPDIIVGAGAADGDAEPFLSANKGSLYLRTDASDDATHVFQKLDEGGDDDDWASLSSFGGTLAETLTVGEDDTGYDVKFFGATSGSYWLWDESADKMIIVGDSQLTGTLTVGVDDTGHDVKFFGATSGAYWLWDESADTVLRDGGTLLVKAVASGDAGMTVSADGMTADPEGDTEAGFIAVDIAGTGYQIPIYAA